MAQWWRLILATIVIAVWGTAIVADFLSSSYAVDPGLHAVCGILVGGLVGFSLPGRGKKDDDNS